MQVNLAWEMVKKIVLGVYYLVYKNTWGRLTSKRGSGFLLNLLLSIFTRSDPEYLIRVSDGRVFKGSLWNPRYRALYWHRTHEPAETGVFEKLIRTGDIVLDIGANIGWYTTLAGKLVGDGRVFAFEPIDIVAAELRRNVNFNNLHNVSVQQMAVSDISGMTNIWFDEGNWGYSSLNRQNSQGSVSRCVRVTTLDDWVRTNSIGDVSLVKCDIEGAEVLFLNGARETIHRFQPILLLEFNKPALANLGFSPSDFLNTLDSYGYESYVIERGPRKGFTLEKVQRETSLEAEVNILAIPSRNQYLYNRYSDLIGSGTVA